MSEIKHTDEYKAIIRLIEERYEARKDNTLVEARRADLAHVRYQIGTVDGLKEALDILEEQ